MNNWTNKKIVKWENGKFETQDGAFVDEEPLSIRIQGAPYSVIMRTPGEELAHAAGFCLAEGIVDRRQDIASLAFCDGSDSNVVAVTLTKDRREKIGGRFDRREYVSQSSCGICGKHLVEELRQEISPVLKQTELDIGKCLERLENLNRIQPLRSKTRAAHAAAIFDGAYELLSVSEDVGRHNALDKAVGRLFLDEKLDRARFLVLSSRISYELVQKAARARIPAIFAVSRPTTLAVSLAEGLDIALASLTKKGGLFIYCGRHRLI